MKIAKTTLSQIKSYRYEYFTSLIEFQELYLELMVRKSDYYLLQVENKEIGYTIINNEGVLIEFYVASGYVPDSNIIFKFLLKELSVSNIYCKTFDSLLLSSCVLNSLSYSVIGVLFRDYTRAKVEKDVSLQMVKIDLSSIEILLRQDESLKELYETEELLIEFIENENVFIFYKNNELIGCGMVIKTNKDWDFCDLGVWVNRKQRGNGFGAQILLNLREFAVNNNLKPSCGCAIDHLASRKTIEKSGFVSRYQLINFKTE
jgi:predicted acetyltransferase